MTDNALETVLRNLESQDVNVRYAALLRLEAWEPAPVDAIPALIQALADSAFKVLEEYEEWDDRTFLRDHARTALLRMKTAALPMLRQALNDSTPAIRWSAADILGAYTAADLSAVDPAQVLSTLHDLEDSRHAVARRAFQVEWSLVDGAVTDDLTRLHILITHPDVERRLEAVEALGRYATADVSITLATLLLRDPQGRVQHAAAEALRKHPPTLPDEWLSRLMASLDNPNHADIWPEVMNIVVRYAERAQSLVPVLCRLVLSPPPNPSGTKEYLDYRHCIRRTAAQSLLVLGSWPPAFVSELVQLFLHGDARERQLAIDVVGVDRVAAAVLPSLIERLHSREELDDSCDRLKDLGLAAVPCLPALLPWIDPALPSRLSRGPILLLGGLGDAARGTVPKLLELLHYPEHREWASYALNSLKAVEAIPVLEAILEPRSLSDPKTFALQRTLDSLRRSRDLPGPSA